MLTALGDFLAVIVTPLNNMGANMALNSATVASERVSGYGTLPMSTTGFNMVAGPWVDAAGSIVQATATLLVKVSDFLISLVGLL